MTWHKVLRCPWIRKKTNDVTNTSFPCEYTHNNGGFCYERVDRDPFWDPQLITNQNRGKRVVDKEGLSGIDVILRGLQKPPAFLLSRRAPTIPRIVVEIRNSSAMALKAVLVADVPGIDKVPELSATTHLPRAVAQATASKARFVVVGHRGKGMNALGTADQRLRAVKENSLLSFNRAALFPIDFVEFDVQVTKDDCPIIFHDDIILTEVEGKIVEKHVTDLYLEEFLSYGPQRDPCKMGKVLFRKTNDGKVLNWNVEDDDSLCTLQEAFEKVDPQLGFNIELKFIDHAIYPDDELTHALEVVLKVVFDHANNRPIMFSTFQPDAARLLRKLQSSYPVFFLTVGGTETFDDERRNSLDEAIKLCVASGLQGIVSEVRGVFSNPSAVSRIKEHNLSLLTYGHLNNVREAVYMQHLMGIDGVIVDLVEEITEAVSGFTKPASTQEGSDEGFSALVEETRASTNLIPNFSQIELLFLLNLIPELLRH
ncbi:glycerophosphodiester phosphodiesterase GDPD1, chloroplastic-like [Canna indica]|uniref:glycerophosphodiester phosphodiesterase n=1 Tax=Canna indica TaxID=4628 RepID=A0AAQ3QBT4_9LILI|nr:glycerophosphodiester phosphodiesterase GDPD1, chloroplastic-like [Canna indica]